MDESKVTVQLIFHELQQVDMDGNYGKMMMAKKESVRPHSHQNSMNMCSLYTLSIRLYAQTSERDANCH